MSRDARPRIAELEDQLTIAKVLARRLWIALSVRVERAAAELFYDGLTDGGRRVLNVAFDAAEIVWERHRLFVEPARRVLDQPSPAVSAWDWPQQAEMYLAHRIDGETQVITRSQLLMMAGMDSDA